MTHPIVEMLEQIYRARHQIAASYDDRGITLDDEEAMLIQPLIKSYFMRRKGDNEFRLSARFRSLFDLPLRRQKISSIDTSLGDEVKALELAMHIMSEGGHDGVRHETRMEHLGEVEDIIDSIHDLLEDTATKIQNRLNSNFGLLASSKAKQAENQSYLIDLEKLIESFNETRARLHEEPFTDDLDVMGYIQNLEAKCLPIIDKIKRCQNTIREFLFKQREIEHKARRIRGVITHLKKNPGFYPEIAESECDTTPLFAKSEPIKMSGYPDIKSRYSREVMAELVVEIQQRTQLPQVSIVEKQDSHLDTHEMETEEEQIPVAITAVMNMLSYVYKENVKISLKSYWNKNDGGMLIALDEFAFEAINFLQSNPHIDDMPVLDYVNFELDLIDDPVFSGNKWLNDIIVFPLAMRV